MRIILLISIAIAAIPRNGHPGETAELIAARLWQQKGYVMPSVSDRVAINAASKSSAVSPRLFPDDDDSENFRQVTVENPSQEGVRRKPDLSLREAIRRVFDEDERNTHLPLNELLPKLRLVLPSGDLSNVKSVYAQVAKVRRERLARRNRTASDTLEVVPNSRLDMTKEFLGMGENRLRKNVDLIVPLERFFSQQRVRNISRRTLASMLSEARGSLSAETGEDWSVVRSKRIKAI